ncbi:MAG: FadR family transcriptional regulator [Firmicutes bacterium]|nr:FadR family transcriptional regulator [Bacillota bacterium]
MEALLREGALKPGDKLPPEAELCQIFGVSRPVLREAFAGLRELGILRIERGSGTFVANPVAEATGQRLARHLAGSAGNLLALMEVRLALEPEAARLAAERATADDIQDIEAAFRAMEQAVVRGDVGSDEDYRFHHTLAAATHNEVFQRVIELIGDLFIRSLWVSRQRSMRFVERPRQALEEHRAVLEAVRRGEAASAWQAMRAHLLGARQRLIDERGIRVAEIEPETLRTDGPPEAASLPMSEKPQAAPGKAQG